MSHSSSRQREVTMSQVVLRVGLVAQRAYWGGGTQNEEAGRDPGTRTDIGNTAVVDRPRIEARRMAPSRSSSRPLNSPPVPVLLVSGRNGRAMRVARGCPIRSVGHGRAVLAGSVAVSAMGPLDTSQMEGELGGEGGQPKTKETGM